jgi:DNA-binding ferritin-like protein
MSEQALKRIEKAIAKLGEQQAEICERIMGLEQRVSGSGGKAGASREETIAFLDQFRAGEALGEASLGAWIEVSDTTCVRGGLRTVQAREGMHARLLEQRIKELGGTPEAEVPEAVYSAAMEQAGSREKTDAQKVKDFVARFSDIDAALAPIHELADRLDDDPETQSLLRTIVQDERSTLEFLTDACQQLNPS